MVSTWWHGNATTLHRLFCLPVFEMWNSIVAEELRTCSAVLALVAVCRVMGIAAYNRVAQVQRSALE